MPWSSAYYRGKYEIDPLNLSANIITPNVEQRVAVRRGSGYLLEFELRRVAAASVHLIDAHQQDLALGSAVLNEQNGARASGPGHLVGQSRGAVSQGLLVGASA